MIWACSSPKQDATHDTAKANPVKTAQKEVIAEAVVNKSPAVKAKTPKVKNTTPSTSEDSNKNTVSSKASAETKQSTYASNKADEKGRILYDASKLLTWSNFKGRPNMGSSHHAFTETGIAYEPIDYNREMIVLKVYSYFDINRSWVKPEKDTDYLLNHEQLHFDVCELARRKMMESLDVAQPISGADFNNVMSKLFKKHFNAMNDMQHEYDHHTKHSINVPAQEEWDKKIATDLKNLEKYKDFVITLKLK